MVWARLDDAILDNAKIVRAGPIGFALHVAAITWCARNLTDGFIPKLKAMQLLPTTWVVGGDDANGTIWTLSAVSGYSGIDGEDLIAQCIELLEASGLWLEEVERGVLGYRLHDYDKYNPTRAEVLEERERKAGNVAAYRARRAAQTGSRAADLASNVTTPVTGNVTGKTSKGNSGPDPGPVPDPKERESDARAPEESEPTPEQEAAETPPPAPAVESDYDLGRRVFVELWEKKYGERWFSRSVQLGGRDDDNAFREIGRWATEHGSEDRERFARHLVGQFLRDHGKRGWLDEHRHPVTAIVVSLRSYGLPPKRQKPPESHERLVTTEKPVDLAETLRRAAELAGRKSA